LRPPRDDWESGFHRRPLKLRVNLEIAEEFFRYSLLVFAIKRLQIRPRAKANFRNRTRKFGRVALAIRNRTGHGVNDDVLRSGIIFCGIRVGDVEYVAGEFDEGVLKSAAGAKKRPIPATGELNAVEHPFETLVGTARRGPKTVETLQRFFSAFCR
jgi:hypothetical protein